MGLIKGEYPQPTGRKLLSVANVPGPASYTQVTPGNPPTGGQVLSNLQQIFGFNYVDHVDAGASSNGQYDVTVIHSSTDAGIPQITLVWTVAATGAQVTAGTNLSGVTVRLKAIGA